MRKCRKCDFEAELVMELRAHHRAEHPVEHDPFKPVLSGVSPSQAKLRREKFLECLKEGMNTKQACSAVGWTTHNSYTYNRREYPAWGHQVDQVRAALRAEKKEAKKTAEQIEREKRQMEKARSSGRAPKKRRSNHNTALEQGVDAFRDFAVQYFPDRRPHQPQQLRIVAELNNLRPREVCLFLVHPEAGKTATFEDHICRTLALDPNHRFRIISEAGDLSKRIVGTCARRFTDDTAYHRFIKDFGPFYEKGQERHGKPWTTEQLTVLRNSGGERDRSLVASSWSSAVYGSRIDTLIIDDIQSQRNFNQAEEIFRRVRGTFFNRGLEMRTLIVGTRIGPGDFYDRMMEAGLITRKVVLPAADPNGEPTVPEFWADGINMIHDGGPCCMGFRSCPRNMAQLTPKEKMEQMRHQSGEDTWWAAYQQNPVSDERSTFGQYLDRCLDRNRKIGELVSA